MLPVHHPPSSPLKRSAPTHRGSAHLCRHGCFNLCVFPSPLPHTPPPPPPISQRFPSLQANHLPTDTVCCSVSLPLPMHSTFLASSYHILVERSQALFEAVALRSHLQQNRCCSRAVTLTCTGGVQPSMTALASCDPGGGGGGGGGGCGALLAQGPSKLLMVMTDLPGTIRTHRGNTPHLFECFSAKGRSARATPL